MKNKLKKIKSEWKAKRGVNSVIWLGVVLVMGSLFSCSETKASEHLETPIFSDASKARLSTQQVLATNLYHESRGESDLGNMMIMAVIENRKNLGGRYGDSYERVIFKPKAFSWLDDGLSDRMHNPKQYRRSYELVERFLLDKQTYLLLAQGADHYHRVGHKTNWNYSKLIYLFRVDNHVFYKHK